MGFITTTDEHIASGGTISGNLTIDADLTVSGSTAITTNEVIQGTSIIDVTNTEAFLVRKNGDGGDLLVADTTNMRVGIGVAPDGKFHIESGSAGTVGTLSYADDLIIENSGAVGISLRSPDGNSGSIVWQSDTSDNIARIYGAYNSGDEILAFETVGTERMVIDDSGNIGVGTSTPSTLVEIQGGLTTTGAVLTLSTKEPTIVANDVLGKINFQSPLDTGADSDLVGASIHALATDTFSDTVNATDLIFSTGASETATEKMRIASTGAITLAGTLTVNGTNTTIANATNPYLYINDTNAGAAIFQQSGNDTRIGSDSNTQVLFVQSNATAMTISTDKYLGIGTSSPATNLHVKTTDGNHGIEIESDSAAVLTFDHAGNDEARILFKEADTTEGSIIYTSTGTDTMQFKVGSNGERMRITGGGNVGIGIAAPDGAGLHIHSATAGTVTAHANADELVVEGDGATGISILTADDETGAIMFGCPSDTQAARITNVQSTGVFTVGASQTNGVLKLEAGAGTTRMIIDDNSRISLSNNDTGTSSTVFGYLAGMPGSANALGNVFIGQEAGENVGSHDSDGNVMIGYRAGRGTFTAATDHNIGIGYTALNVLTSGHGNVVMGSGAGIAIQDAESNVAIGRNALGQVVSSNQSIAIGFNSGYGLTTGANNTVIGAEALYNSADIDRAVVIGKNALYAGNATSGADGTIAIGYDAARALTSGGQNIAIGYEALHDCTTGRRNTVIGYQAADTLTAGSDDNTAVGYAALGAGNHDTTHQNSCFGYGAGDTITTGSNNTCLGSQANVSASGAVGQIAIGQAVTCTADNTATLGIGSNTASLGLDGSDTSWAAASSDKRLKENIETSSAGLDVINDLRPVTYNWKKAKDVDNGMPQYKDSEEPVLGLEYGETLHGFIAQEVKEVVDNHSSLKEGFKMWKLKDDGTQTVADGNLIPILVKAVQELTAKVEELEKK